MEEVPVGICIRCNAGVITTKVQGYYGDIPEPVWILQSGLVNILSHSLVAKHCNVYYNNLLVDEFIMTMPTGNVMKFKPTAKGLYTTNLSANSVQYSVTLPCGQTSQCIL